MYGLTHAESRPANLSAIVIDGWSLDLQDCLAADDRAGWVLRLVRPAHGDYLPGRAGEPVRTIHVSGCQRCDDLRAGLARRNGHLHTEILTGDVRYVVDPQIAP